MALFNVKDLKNKDPRLMTPAAINRELQSLRDTDSQLTDQMIEAGRGRERIQETLRKDDPLALAIRAVSDRRGALRSEIERRWGPGQTQAIERMPKTIRHASGAHLTPRR